MIKVKERGVSEESGGINPTGGHVETLTKVVSVVSEKLVNRFSEKVRRIMNWRAFVCDDWCEENFT